MNVLRSSMEITDQFYSNLDDNEIRERIWGLGSSTEQNGVTIQNIDALIGVLKSMKASAKEKAPAKKAG